jgi:hypothetical protein
MIRVLQCKKIFAAISNGRSRIAGIVFLLSVLFCGLDVRGQTQQPAFQHVQLNNNTFIIQSRAMQISEPDPFDMLVSSAASFDIDSPVEAKAEFDPTNAPVSGHVVYRVVVSALDESLTMPDTLPAPKELNLHRGGRGQTYQRTGGMKLRPQTTVIYRTVVTNLGTFMIPAFDLMAYGKPVRVPAATLQVVAAGSVSNAEPPMVFVDVPKEDCYVGQLLKIPLILPMGPGGGISALYQPRITSEFIFSEQVPTGIRIENVQHDGKTFTACLQELLITPLRAGRQELIAQGHASIPRPNPKQPGTMERDDVLVDSEPVTLTVKPLPTDGVLLGFTGAVGTFVPDVPLVSPPEVHAGQPVTLTVQVRGEGNLGRLVPPRVPPMREWQTFPPVTETTSSASVLQRGFATFKYTMIPLSDKIQGTPVIPFSYFDPKQKAYVAMNIPSAPLNVLPGAPGFQAHLPPLESPPPDPEDSSREKEPVFTGVLAKPGLGVVSMAPLQQRWWFALMQIAPAMVIGGLWSWDRRRRYLEQHPEVILKRRARRGLRRQLQLARRAAASRDAAGFVTGAANALREACAPHSAANPNALVCADVLQELPEQKRQGPVAETVRRLFAAADALRFGGNVREGGELLSLQPQVEQLLAELKMRL